MSTLVRTLKQQREIESSQKGSVIKQSKEAIFMRKIGNTSSLGLISTSVNKQCAKWVMRDHSVNWSPGLSGNSSDYRHIRDKDIYVFSSNIKVFSEFLKVSSEWSGMNVRVNLMTSHLISLFRAAIHVSINTRSIKFLGSHSSFGF